MRFPNSSCHNSASVNSWGALGATYVHECPVMRHAFGAVQKSRSRKRTRSKRGHMIQSKRGHTIQSKRGHRIQSKGEHRIQSKRGHRIQSKREHKIQSKRPACSLARVCSTTSESASATSQLAGSGANSTLRPVSHFSGVRCQQLAHTESYFFA